MFKSNEDFWRTVHEFIAELEKSGNAPAADELKNGKSLVTGLTDGWADFLESIEKVMKQHSSQLSSTQKSTLKNIHREMYQRTYCNYRGPGWQIHARIQRLQGNLYKRQQNKKQRR
ncbi:MAG: hypothetical protein WC455_00290 [Dehalococcoidia bacterium]|jgi:DNA replication initiation complex subunit (GINS family)